MRFDRNLYKPAGRLGDFRDGLEDAARTVRLLGFKGQLSGSTSDSLWPRLCENDRQGIFDMKSYRHRSDERVNHAAVLVDTVRIQLKRGSISTDRPVVFPILGLASAESAFDRRRNVG